MQLTRADSGTCAVLRVSGSVRPLDGPRLREALSKAMAHGPTCIVCDLSAVTGLNPVCVAVLVAAQWSAPWPGPVVWLAGAHGQPADALRATGAALFLALADSAQAALAQQAAAPPLLRERLILAPQLTAPARARRFTAEVLDRWAVPDVTEEAALVVGELVTNGVQHAGTDLELRLEHGQGLLHIAVRDHADATGHPWDRGRTTGRQAGEATGHPGTATDAMLEHGRGLEIVRAIADGCGHTSVPAGGSVCWATLRTDTRLARREPVGSGVSETIVVDARRDLRHPGHGWTVRLQLAWRPDDPQHVTLDLSSAPAHPVLPVGHWRIQRETLRRGLDGPVRDHNVALHPTPDRLAILFDLHIGRLVRSARVPARRVQRFLERLPPTPT